MFSKNLMIKIFLLVLLILPVFSLWPPNAKEVDKIESVDAIIIPVQSRVMDTRVPIGGTVTALKSVILAAQLPGRVVMIAGEEGDKFSDGKLLLSLNDEDLRAKRRTAETQWAGASAELQNASVQYSRRLISPAMSNNAPGGMGLPGMFDQVFVNPMASMMGTRQPGVERGADIYASGTHIEQARQALARAHYQIQQIDTKLRDARSIAPFDGVIVKKHVEVGDTVQPGQPLLDFADLRILQIIADIPTRFSGSLQEGDKIAAKIDVSETLIEVQIATIFPTADPIRHTVRVKFNLPPIIKVAPGTYAEVWIPSLQTVTGVKQTVVPATAVVERGGLPAVFVVNEKQRTELRLVRIGETLPSGEVVIVFGVTETDRNLDKPAPHILSGYLVSNSAS